MATNGTWIWVGAALGLAASVGGPSPGWVGGGDMGNVAGPVAARVLRVVDGDTLLVRAHIWLGQEVETHVRLAGVDAPELRSACARERELAKQASDLVARLVGDGEIALHDVRYDKYGRRVVARVETSGGVDLAAALLSAGLGRLYAGKSRSAWCDRPSDR